MNTEYGSLSVRAYTAGGALPVVGAIVRIFGAEEDNREVVHSLLTDTDGKAPTVKLPTPNKSYSMAPGPSERPYALYDLEISADEYYTKQIRGVSVFSGITSLQLVNMIPLSQNEIGGYPRGNVNANIPDYNDL